MKKVSLILPIYNVEDYLIKCIESCLNQTYKNIEIILVDDGSIDNCPSICDNYALKDDRIKVIHKKNGGLSDARNAGLDIASGEYISFIDSDDFVSPDYVEKLLEIIKDSDIAMVNRYNTTDDISLKDDYYKPLIVDNITSKELFALFAEDKQPHEAWAKLYKKEVFSDRKYKVGLKVFEDVEFIMNLLKEKELKININTSLYLYYYVQRSASIMNEKFNKLWNDELLFYLKLIEEEKDKSIKNKLISYMFLLCNRNLIKVRNSDSVNKIETRKTVMKCLKVGVIKHITCGSIRINIRLLLFKLKNINKG